MSAAALRRPARWQRFVPAELAVARSEALPWILGFAALSPLSLADAGEVRRGEAFDHVLLLAVLMFFFPLLHGRQAASRHSLDAAVPVPTVPLDLVRVACGAAWGAVTLAIVAGGSALSIALVHGTDRGLAGFPVWYPLSLVLLGLRFYLFGAAVQLAARRPAPAMGVALILGMIAFQSFELGLYSQERLPGETVRWTTTLTVGSGVAWLLAAAATVGLTSWLVTVRPGLRRPALRPWFHAFRPAAGGRPLRKPARGAAVPGLRRSATLHAVAFRQIAVQAPRMLWPLLFAALAAWRNWTRAVEAGPSIPRFAWWNSSEFGIWLYVAFFWPVLVWMNERRPGGWEESRPVGLATRRLLHAAAGLVWLWLALGLVAGGTFAGSMKAGSLPSLRFLDGWIWPGLPLAVMALYCLGSLTAVLSEHPIGYGIAAFIGMMLVTVGLRLPFGLDEAAPLSPDRVLAPVNWVSAHDWSALAAAIWVPIFILAAGAAIWLRTRRDLYGYAFRRPSAAQLRAGEAA